MPRTHELTLDLYLHGSRAPGRAKRYFPSCGEPEGLLSLRAQVEGPPTGPKGHLGPVDLGSNRVETLAGGTVVRRETLPLRLTNPAGLLQETLCLRTETWPDGDTGHWHPHLANYYSLCSSDEALFCSINLLSPFTDMSYHSTFLKLLPHKSVTTKHFSFMKSTI